MCSMFSSEPVSRLSRQITRCPSPSSRSQRWDPRKPAPPVTTQVLTGAILAGHPASGRSSHSVCNFRTYGLSHLSNWGRAVPLSYLSLPVSDREHLRGRGNRAVEAIDAHGAKPRASLDDGARKRAAVETYARHEAALRRTARRYSLCADDADDALQRGLEILLRKAPTAEPRELVKWMQTVVKHEALAVRRDRERVLAGPAAFTPAPDAEDW